MRDFRPLLPPSSVALLLLRPRHTFRDVRPEILYSTVAKIVFPFTSHILLRDDPQYGMSTVFSS